MQVKLNPIAERDARNIAASQRSTPAQRDAHIGKTSRHSATQS